MSDGRLKTLKAADPARIEAAQKRYELISTTIDDAVSRLQKIVNAGEESLRGEWVGKLKKKAEAITGDLAKAGVRYRDVATEIKKYEPELQHAIDEVKAAESAEADGSASLTRANAMPDPQKGPDGTIAPEEEQKGADKKRAQDEATGQVTAAKNRLTSALDALGVAGKRFGDAVNCKKYHDGLTDKISWRIMAIFKKISEIFGIIAMVLTAVAFLIPGLNVLAIAAVAASAVLLIADSVLLAGGDGSVLSVVLDAVGLGLAGLGAAFGHFSKMIEGFSKFLKGLPALKIKTVFGSNGQLIKVFDFSKPLAIAGPGFFEMSWANLGNLVKNWGTSWAKNLIPALLDTGTWKNLSFLNGLPTFGGAFSAGANGLKWIFASWGGLNQGFNFGAGLIIGGLQVTKNPAFEGV